MLIMNSFVYQKSVFKYLLYKSKLSSHLFRKTKKNLILRLAPHATIQILSLQFVFIGFF